MLKDKKCSSLIQENAYIIKATTIWHLITHGYRFANNIYSHDALLEVCQDDSAWQIAIGRFMQPILIFLRGGIGSPWLISVCALIWMCLATSLLVRLLNVRHLISIIILTGVMVCNPILISINAAFLPCVDFYALALFLSIFGVWLCKRGGWRSCVCGVMSMMLAMGIYQAYICVSIVLIMILLLREGQENAVLKAVLKRVVYYGSVLLASALLYYLMWRIFRSIFGIWAADSYNGMASLGDYSEVSFLSLLALVYKKYFNIFGILILL